MTTYETDGPTGGAPGGPGGERPGAPGGGRPDAPVGERPGGEGSGPGDGAAAAGAGGCPPEIRQALAAHTTLTLAYADDDGPQACAVLYAPGGDASAPLLYFVTAHSTRHGRALARPGARVAFTAQRDGQEWSGLTGLQGRGGCRELTGAARMAGWNAYTGRFPFVAGDERLRAALERTALWELRPDWLRLIDNGRGFGHKQEWRPRDA
ncbi:MULTISPECIES: pyridoxamine 5'-phosphate oxidase family protein [Streptomyces]|uniref:Pyridoxamine 5'-phosphate oxidase family protein n=1 Tax=Streptomyces ramulosus TaxID=47762 RepID=A0ABW1FP01_9ACTN